MMTERNWNWNWWISFSLLGGTLEIRRGINLIRVTSLAQRPTFDAITEKGGGENR